MPDRLDRDVRHRHGLPWYAAPAPRRWHSCRAQTIELHRTNGSLFGICHCACGALTDRTGRWIGRNSRRRTPDTAGLRRDPKRRSLSARGWRRTLLTLLPAATRVLTRLATPSSNDDGRAHQTGLVIDSDTIEELPQSL